MTTLIYGTAARFDTLTDDGRACPVAFAPGCFSKALSRGNSIPLKLNHSGATLASTSSNLDIWADSSGLHWCLELPANSERARELESSVRAGELAGSSVSIRGKSESRIIGGRRCEVFTDIYAIEDVGPVSGAANSWSRTSVCRAWEPVPFHIANRKRNAAAVAAKKPVALTKADRDRFKKLNADFAADMSDVVAKHAALSQPKQSVANGFPNYQQHMNDYQNCPGLKDAARRHMADQTKALMSSRTSVSDMPLCDVHDDAVDIWLHGVIGEDGLDSETVAKLLAENRGKPVNIRVNSAGGLAYDGVSIYVAIDAHDGPTTGIIEGMAGSAASLAVIACDTVKCHAGSVFVPHYSMIGAFGHQADLENALASLKRLDLDMEVVYSEASGQSIQKVKKDLLGPNGDGTRFSAEQALAAGYVDEIIPHKKRKRPAARTAGQKRAERARQKIDALTASIKRRELAARLKKIEDMERHKTYTPSREMSLTVR